MAPTPEEWYATLPVITKYYFSLSLVVTLMADFLNIITPYHIHLEFYLIFNKFQLWRFISNFFFFWASWIELCISNCYTCSLFQYVRGGLLPRPAWHEWYDLHVSIWIYIIHSDSVFLARAVFSGPLPGVYGDIRLVPQGPAHARHLLWFFLSGLAHSIPLHAPIWCTQ